MNQSSQHDSSVTEQQINFVTRLCELEEYAQAEFF